MNKSGLRQMFHVAAGACPAKRFSKAWVSPWIPPATTATILSTEGGSASGGKFSCRCLTGLICLFCIIPAPLIAATNETGKIINPGFEEGNKLPDGWTTYQGGDCCVFVWDKVTAHSGQRSVYVCNADRNGSAAWVNSCKMKESTTYRFAVWVKIRKGQGQGITLLKARGSAKGMDKHWEATSEGKGDTGNKWQLLEWIFTTPPGLEPQVQLWLWNINGRGDQVWFDDVEFGEVAKPPVPPRTP